MWSTLNNNNNNNRTVGLDFMRVFSKWKMTTNDLVGSKIGLWVLIFVFEMSALKSLLFLNWVAFVVRGMLIRCCCCCCCTYDAWKSSNHIPPNVFLKSNLIETTKKAKMLICLHYKFKFFVRKTILAPTWLLQLRNNEIWLFGIIDLIWHLLYRFVLAFCMNLVFCCYEFQFVACLFGFVLLH